VPSYEWLQFINNDEIKDAIPPIGFRVLFRVDGVEGGLNKNNFMLYKIRHFLIPTINFSKVYVYCKKNKKKYI